MHELEPKTLFSDALSSNRTVLLQHFHGIFKVSIVSPAVNRLTLPSIQPSVHKELNTSLTHSETFQSTVDCFRLNFRRIVR